MWATYHRNATVEVGNPIKAAENLVWEANPWSSEKKKKTFTLKTYMVVKRNYLTSLTKPISSVRESE